MLNEKDYCDYDTCVALKDLGYNRGAYAYYFPNLKEDLIFNTHPMRGCSINEMARSHNTYSSDTIGHELIDAPIMWEAQKWLREEKGLFIEITICFGKYDLDINYTKVEDDNTHRVLCEICGFDSYEEALLEGIKSAVKIVKEEKNNGN